MMWYPIEKRLKTRVLKWLASHPLGNRRTPPGEVDIERIGRILIIRQHDQFGDFLLTPPAIHALRARGWSAGNRRTDRVAG